MDVLQAKLSQTIMVGITTGQSYDEMARHLKTQVVKDVPTISVHPNCRCAVGAYWMD